MSKRILVTGGTGNIGRVLVPMLRASGYEVDAPGRRQLDLSRPGLLIASGLPTYNAIIHLAQSRRFRECTPEARKDVVAVNLRASLELLQIAESWAHADHHMSVVLATAPVPDNADNIGLYGATKKCVEILAAQFVSPNLSVCCLRPYQVYGPGVDRGIVHDLLQAYMNGSALTLSNADRALSPVHVRDAARGFIAALEAGVSGVFDLPGRDLLTVRELRNLVADLLMYLREACPVKPGGGSLAGSWAAAYDAFGWRPQIRIADALRSSIAFSCAKELPHA
jgi:nucleoside-diphosphate-sugar epimerase